MLRGKGLDVVRDRGVVGCVEVKKSEIFPQNWVVWPLGSVGY